MGRRKRVGPTLVRLTRRWVARIFRPSPEEEVNEEIDFHVEMRVRDNLRDGMSPGEARRDALARFGNMEQVKEECRRSRRRRDGTMARRDWVVDVWQDLRQTVRRLRRAPTFAVAAGLTLAVGIGANTAVFSVVHGVLLSPLPYPHPEDLVRVWGRFLPESGYESDRFTLSPTEAVHYRQDSKVMEDMAYYQFGHVTFTGDGADPDRVMAVAGSVNLLPLLGVRPALGRFFKKDEGVLGGTPVAILDHDLWASRFGSDPGAVGRSVTINGASVQIVGVMPAGFRFPAARPGVYLPIGVDESNPGPWANHFVQTLGRLTPGASLSQASGELASLNEAWRAEFGHPQKGHFVYLTNLRQSIVGDSSSALWMLLVAVGLVLLIATANVAGLVLARGESRLREMAVRVALGAGRRRILRQLVTESLLLSLLGAGLGVGLAAAILAMVRFIDPEALPRMDQVHLSLPVLAFTGVVAVGVALIFGLFPALAAARGAQAQALAGIRTPESARSRRLRSVLVGAEVALSVLVVISAGLVGRSFAALISVDTGIETSGRLTFELNVPRNRYRTGPERARLVSDLLEHVEAVPGLTAATFTTTMPIVGGLWLPDFHIEGRAPPPPGGLGVSGASVLVSPGYFETMGIKVVQGRPFRSGDREGAEPVAVVNEEAARRFWPDGDAVGARIGLDRTHGDLPWITVVGVVADTPVESVDHTPFPKFYAPFSQGETSYGFTGSYGSMVLRTTMDPGQMVGGVRRAVAEVDPDLPVPGLTTMTHVVRGSMAKPRLTSSLLSGFALAALLLALVGVYGLVSYGVARRRREIGIRLALGADKRGVVSMMIRQGFRPVLMGAAVGLLGAFATTSYLKGLLYRVSPTDPATFVLLPLGLVAVAVLASWVPARHAARVAPVESLRED